jgi:predicted  nucleic acid-binding Zn-ribbon protein
MIEEKYLQMAINIRRTYLKLINNMDLYRARALQVSERLDETLKKIDDFNEKLNTKDPDAKKVNLTEKEIFENLLKIIDEVDEEGKKLEKLISPVNIEIEKLSKEEIELYRLIVENHPTLTEDQIVEKVQDRLIKEGLS